MNYLVGTTILVDTILYLHFIFW